MIKFLKIVRLKILIIFYRMIPIKKNKIIFWSNSFKGYGCNPKYIAEYLMNNCNDNRLDIVWVLEKEMEVPKNIPEQIRIVRYFSKEYLYELLTAKLIVTNHRMAEHYYFKKRKYQIYIQTWHSSTRLKKIERDAESDLSKDYINSAINDSKKCDFIISGSEFSTNIYKNSFWYSGEILEFGTPRSDIMYVDKQEIENKIKVYYNIPYEKRLVIYAPTFRKEKSIDVYNIEYINLIEALKEKFDGDWVILYRLHPNISNMSSYLNIDNSLIYDVSGYEDIQELLVASDVLLTDYSSCMFDFALVKKPCFLYTPDLYEYISKEREFYFNIEELPFTISQDNRSLVENIISFDSKNYQKKCNDFIKKIGSFEDGKATQRICKFIIKNIFDNI